jgi:antirestriction protein ArdC
MRANLGKGMAVAIPFSLDGGFMDNQTRWTELLQQAVMEPGLILRAYSAFHGYSLGNQIAAIFQCQLRGIEPGPINTYPGWQKLNRQVRKGEKALWLCMPLTRKMKDEASGAEQAVITTFVWKPHWFVLAQTEGEPIQAAQTPAWDKARALARLGIEEIPFTATDGNVQGYARKREIAVSPLAAIPHKTLLHELAHVELGHTQESGFTDSEHTPRSLREAEAEAVALLLCESLELPGTEYARGYIQSWLKGNVIPEKSAQRIFGAADRILRAGREQ